MQKAGTVKPDAKRFRDYNDPYTVVAIPDKTSTFSTDSIRIFPGQRQFGKTPYMKDLGNLIGVYPDSYSQMLLPESRVYQDSSYMYANPEFMPIRKKQEGGSAEQDQLMQIIQIFAEMQGVDPEEIMQRLQQLSPEQQQQAIQQMVQVVQQAMQEQQGMQQQGMPQEGMQQQMMPPEQQAMMAQGGSWYYGGYMNHPMMEPNGYQHPVALFEMGGMNQMKQGGIHIDPRKKGTFKAQATKMGMSVQEAARHILRNKDKYSPAMVRKANFARNFAKEFGGQLDDQDLMELY